MLLEMIDISNNVESRNVLFRTLLEENKDKFEFLKQDLYIHYFVDTHSNLIVNYNNYDINLNIGSALSMSLPQYWQREICAQWFKREFSAEYIIPRKTILVFNQICFTPEEEFRVFKEFIGDYLEGKI